MADTEDIKYSGSTAAPDPIIGTPNYPLRLVSRLDVLQVRYGREDSFKLGREQLIAGRVLIGVDCARLAAGELLAIATELGMPAAGVALLAPLAIGANAVFFGFEPAGDSWVCKVYLEFWDRVREEVRRTGTRAPQLLHLGVKWDPARPGRHEVARYECHPMLGLREIGRRMALCFPEAGAAVRDAAQAVVRLGAGRQPKASMLYLEVSETGNPRRSFDINLYKTGLLVADASEQLRRAGAHLSVAPDLLESQLTLLGGRPLGHLSAGIDRHGNAFLSVYGETVAA